MQTEHFTEYMFGNLKQSDEVNQKFVYLKKTKSSKTKTLQNRDVGFHFPPCLFFFMVCRRCPALCTLLLTTSSIICLLPSLSRSSRVLSWLSFTYSPAYHVDSELKLLHNKAYQIYQNLSPAPVNARRHFCGVNNEKKVVAYTYRFQFSVAIFWKIKASLEFKTFRLMNCVRKFMFQKIVHVFWTEESTWCSMVLVCKNLCKSCF